MDVSRFHGALLFSIRSAVVDSYTERWGALLGAIDYLGCLRPEHFTRDFLSHGSYANGEAHLRALVGCPVRTLAQVLPVLDWARKYDHLAAGAVLHLITHTSSWRSLAPRI